MIRLTACQLLEGQIHVVLKGLIVLAHLHGVDELDERGEVLFLLGGFVVDIADERRVEQRLGLLPEVVPGFPVPLGVGNEGRDQLQNILLAVDIRKGVVMVGLLEVDGIEYLHLIAITEHELSALHGDAALRNSFVKIENGSITDNFHFRNWRLLHRHASGVSPYLPACPCSPC